MIMAVSKVTIRWLNRWQDVEEVVIQKSNTISVMLIYYLLIIAELQRQCFLTNAIKIHLKAGRRVCQHR